MQLLAAAQLHSRAALWPERRVGQQGEHRATAGVDAKSELAEAADAGREPPIIRARIEHDRHLDLAPLAARDADELVPGLWLPQRIRSRERGHEVGDRELARSREKARLQYVGLAEVAALRAERASGGNAESTAPVLVEDGGKQGRAVEPRPAEPVERPVAGDQRCGPAVADDGMVADRRRHAEARVRRAASARPSRTDSSNQSAWASRASASTS